MPSAAELVAAINIALQHHSRYLIYICMWHATYFAANFTRVRVVGRTHAADAGSAVGCFTPPPRAANADQTTTTTDATTSDSRRRRAAPRRRVSDSTSDGILRSILTGIFQMTDLGNSELVGNPPSAANKKMCQTPCSSMSE